MEKVLLTVLDARQLLAERVRGALDGLSLEDLCRAAAAGAVDRADADSRMWHI